MANHEEGYLNSLRAFVLRARRIRAHSLAQDAALLMKLLHPQTTVHVDKLTGQERLTIDLPPEEQVESAAARVRPLILNDEDAYHAKVMNALSYFGSQAKIPEIEMESIRTLKKQWAKVNPKAESNGYYEVRIQKQDEPETRISDNALAFSWIYGDVVHADTARRAEGQAFGIEERYRAAVPVVVRLMMLAMTTLTYVEILRKRGAIPDLGDVFDEEVVFTEAEIAVTTQVFVAEYDEDGNLPEMPAPGEEYGEGWKPFPAVFGAVTPQPTKSEAGNPTAEDGA